MRFHPGAPARIGAAMAMAALGAYLFSQAGDITVARLVRFQDVAKSAGNRLPARRQSHPAHFGLGPATRLPMGY